MTFSTYTAWLLVHLFSWLQLFSSLIRNGSPSVIVICMVTVTCCYSSRFLSLLHCVIDEVFCHPMNARKG